MVTIGELFLSIGLTALFCICGFFMCRSKDCIAQLNEDVDQLNEDIAQLDEDVDQLEETLQRIEEEDEKQQ